MRFPLRDVIPTGSRPILSVTLVVLFSAAALLPTPSPATLASVLLHLLPIVVLGETLEDQLGRPRYGTLLALAVVLAAVTARALPSAMTTLLYLAATITAGHLALFPTSRIVVSLGVSAVEVPSVFLAGAWVLIVVLTSAPLTGTAAACALGAVSVRLARRPDRGTWTHWDDAR